MNRLPLLIIFGLMISSCVTSKQEITKPYQEALECYYQSIQSGSGNLPCLGQINRLVGKNLQDVEAISLLAQIHWHRYLETEEPKEKEKFIEYLGLLAGTIPYTPNAQDWVAPRLDVFLGDLFVYEANALEDVKPEFFPIEKSFALYKAAAHSYQQSLSLIRELEIGDSISNGLKREKINAASGLQEAISGQLAALFTLQTRIEFKLVPFDESTGGPDRLDLVQQKKEELREQLVAIQQGLPVNGYGNLPIVSFVPNRQKSIANLQKLILDDYLLPAMKDSCTILLDPQKPVSETCETLYRESEKAALYAIVYSVLIDDPGDFRNIETEAFTEFSKALAECAFCP